MKLVISEIFQFRTGTAKSFKLLGFFSRKRIVPTDRPPLVGEF
jgi:hypothetical protein